jgi:hypothetical protein
MPKINADELNTRHNEYLRDIRTATMQYRGDTVKHALALQADAQGRYAAWFAERGVELYFPEGE